MKVLETLYWHEYDPGTHTCWDFVCDAWFALTNTDIRDIATPPDGVASQTRFYARQRRNLIALDAPQSPCLVFMHGVERMPHVGVYYRRTVIHLDTSGVLGQDLTTLRMFYPQVEFFDVPTDRS